MSKYAQNGGFLTKMEDDGRFWSISDIVTRTILGAKLF